MNDEPNYEFVDTNVLVYAYDKLSEKQHEQAVSLLDSLWEARTGCISIQVLQEFFVTVTRKIANPLSIADTSQIISDLDIWRVHSPAVEDVLYAIQIQERYQLSFWDSLIIRSAGQMGCSIVWSEDMNDGQFYGSVQVRNPFLQHDA